MNYNKLVKLIVLLLCVFIAQSVAAFTVVIDAGHGGKDPGACGALTMEKSLNLDIALRLSKMIKAECSDVNVYLTRSTDVFIELPKRADFANSHNADLFISIHANASDNKSMNGAETYTLGLHKVEANFEIAKRENSVMLLEDDQTAYQGFDPNSVESYIMFEFLQDNYLDKSLQFASLVQEQLTNHSNRENRGVRQAGFWVLHRTTCPAVLVEIGFLSNKEEEKYLASEIGKKRTSEAIFNAFLTYKTAIDKNSSMTADNVKVNNNTTKNSVKEETTAQDVEEKNTNSSSTDDSKKPIFAVQIFSTTAPLKSNDATFRGLKGCKYIKDGKYLKYYYGEEASYEDAVKLRNSLQSKFKDCFIIALLNGEQILVKDARTMQK